MLVSTKGRYALRVMLELAQSQPDTYMPLPLIAQRQGISEKYLESIIAGLSKAGLVAGLRGQGCGGAQHQGQCQRCAEAHALLDVSMQASHSFRSQHGIFKTNR